jgi:hypothetical protein
MVLTIDENFVRTQNFWIPEMLGPGKTSNSCFMH